MKKKDERNEQPEQHKRLAKIYVYSAQEFIAIFVFRL